MAKTAENLAIVVSKGIPLPSGKAEAVAPSEVIKSLKRGESFAVAPDYRARVAVAVNYLKKTNQIDFAVVSRAVTEGGLEAARFWRVDR